MITPVRPLWPRLASAVAMLVLSATASAAIPVPTVSGPLRTTAHTYPFGAAAQQRRSQNLQRFGFVGDEYLVRGRANVYDWLSAARGAVVRTPNVPYLTRMLIRRHSDPRRASGTLWLDSARYRALSFANPLSLSDPRTCTTLQTLSAGDSSRRTESGLIWDVYSQVAAWIRSRAKIRSGWGSP